MKALWLLMCFFGGILAGIGLGLILTGSPNLLEAFASILSGAILILVGITKTVNW